MTLPTPSPGGAPFASQKEVHEVWAWNFEKEFDALVAATAHEAGGATLALDMEFPGFVCEEPRTGAQEVRYQAVRENVDRLRPIQLGAAVAGRDGAVRGVWSFNLRFDLAVDEHTEKSVAFLRAAGIDFPRHAMEGIEAATLARRLSGSLLVGHHSQAPCWVTFSGSYDFGYLLKLLTFNHPLPRDAAAFDFALSAFCPRRHELRDELPHGSLDVLARKYGILRRGAAHTAGSDALLTLDLFMRVVGPKPPVDARWGLSPAELSWAHHHNPWYNQGWDPLSWEARWAASAWSLSFPQAASPTPPPWWLASALWGAYHPPSRSSLSTMYTAASAQPQAPGLAPWGFPDVQKVSA